MEIEFDDPDLDRLEIEPKFTAGLAPAVVKGFRKAIGFIRQAIDERDLYMMRGLNFKALDDDRKGQFSMKLNDQWRLILEIRGTAPKKRIGAIEIVDYHR
jgi:toxin HigB-1